MLARSIASTSVLFVTLLTGCASDPVEEEVPDPPPGSVRLELNDVSILVSLPESRDQVSSFLYLLPSNSIFPAGLEDELPSLFSTAPGAPAQLYRAMQVTAFRFVPCPEVMATPCTPQVRLAAQFVFPATAGGYDMDEVALHLFYDLDPGEPEQLATALLELKTTSPVSTAGQPLFVHPALAAGAMVGPWGDQFRALVRRFARKEKLVRVTSMAFVFDQWPFRDTRVENGHVVEETPLRHLATPDTVQSWDIFGDDDRTGNLSSASTAETGPEFFTVRSRYLDSSGAPRDTPKVRAAVDSIARTLNPRVHSAESVDCASCHIARFVKQRAVAAGVSFTSDRAYQPPSWANATRLQDARIEGASANIVQFGYFLRISGNEGTPDMQPVASVSERVIYDSIEAAQLASKLLAP